MAVENNEIKITFKADTDKAQKDVTDMTATLKKLNEISQKLTTITNKMTSANRAFADTTRTSTERVKTLRIHLAQLVGSMHTIYLGLKSVIGVFKNAMQESMDYVENLNLFNVAMGEFAKDALDYAEKVNALMGIDVSEWIRFQAVFQTLITGFGVASDKASVMSQQITQLGYDLSSFFNIRFEDALTKLQSGLSGELEPLRRLGYDLSQTKLQAIALSLGIDKAFTSMTQAEKVMLRYYAIMTQVTTAQGDMARTLEQPANQLRIFQTQLTQLSRALGNTFIPLLNKILPYLIAIAQVGREIFNVFAGLMGFKLIDVDYSSVTYGVSEITDGMEEATDSAKELKRTLMGFDEINALSDSSSGGSGIDTGGGSALDIDIPTYDFLGEATEGTVSQIVKDMKEWLGLTEDIHSLSDLMDTKFGAILNTIGLIVGAIVGARFVTKLGDMVRSLGTLKGALDKVNPKVAGVMGALAGGIVTFVAVKDAVYNLTKGVEGSRDKFIALVGAIGLVEGALLVLTTAGLINPVIAGLTAISIAIGAIIGAGEGARKAIEEINQAIADKAFADNADIFGTNLDTLANSYENFTESLSSPFVDISKQLSETDNINANIKSISDELGGYISALSGASGATDEHLNHIEEKFNELTNELVAKLNVARDAIIISLGGSLAEVAESYGYSAGQILETTEKIVEDYTGLTREAQTSLKNARELYKDTGDLKTYQTTVQGILESLGQSVGYSVDYTSEYTKAWKDIKKLNVNNEKDVSKFLGDIKTSYEKAKTNIETNAEGLIGYLEELKKTALLEGNTTAVAMFEDLIEGVSAQKTKAIGELNTETRNLMDVLTDSLVEGSRNMFKNLSEDATSAQMAQLYFTYADHTIGGISDEIMTLMGELNIEGAKNAREIVTTMGNSLVSQSGAIFKDGGKIATSFKSNFNSLLSSGTTLSNSSISTITSNVRSALETGIGNALKTLNNDLLSKGIDLNVGANLIENYSAIQQNAWKIKKYASGGFPSTGEIFIAREAGAEMVGSIGNNTAVANNEQITEAIRRAVVSGMAEANAMNGNNNPTIENVFKVDSETLYSMVQKGQRSYNNRYHIQSEF